MSIPNKRTIRSIGGTTNERHGVPGDDGSIHRPFFLTTSFEIPPIPQSLGFNRAGTRTILPWVNKKVQNTRIQR